MEAWKEGSQGSSTKLSDLDRKKLYYFMHDVLPCVNAKWGQNLKTGSSLCGKSGYTNVVSDSDCAFGAYLIEAYMQDLVDAIASTSLGTRGEPEPRFNRSGSNLRPPDLKAAPLWAL